MIYVKKDRIYYMFFAKEISTWFSQYTSKSVIPPIRGRDINFHIENDIEKSLFRNIIEFVGNNLEKLTNLNVAYKYLKDFAYYLAIEDYANPIPTEKEPYLRSPGENCITFSIFYEKEGVNLVGVIHKRFFNRKSFVIKGTLSEDLIKKEVTNYDKNHTKISK